MFKVVLGMVSAVFTGLMWGIVIASVNTSAKWWEAASAVGTVVAAVGTAGTLGFLVWQNYHLRNEQKLQRLMQEYVDADNLIRHMVRLRRIGNCVNGPGLASQLSALEELCEQIDSAKSRVSGQPGAAMYLNGLECAITMRDAAKLTEKDLTLPNLIHHVAHIDAAAKERWSLAASWRSEVIAKVQKLGGSIPGVNL
ncbi:hypothetical protein ACOTHZ_11300 [Achromobacter xylosoxidans]